MGRAPRELSGGQRQRVAIGRAIVREPRVFLFDEPLSNLDAALRVHMRVEILKLHQRLGATMVYVTHDQVEAMTLADRIVVLRAGRIEQVGTPLELYREPANTLRRGVHRVPRHELPGRPRRDGRTRAASVPNPPRPTLCTTTLPRRAAAPSGSARSTSNAVRAVRSPATVQVFEHLGGESFVHVTLDDGQGLVAKLDGETGYETGERIELGIAPEKCHVFDAEGRRAAVPGDVAPRRPH